MSDKTKDSKRQKVDLKQVPHSGTQKNTWRQSRKFSSPGNLAPGFRTRSAYYFNNDSFAVIICYFTIQELL